MGYLHIVLNSLFNLLTILRYFFLENTLVLMNKTKTNQNTAAPHLYLQQSNLLHGVKNAASPNTMKF